MSPDERPLNDLAALEAALASLAPRADRLNRDRMMFLAGQASASPPPLARVRTWQAAFTAMAAVAASLLVALVMQPGPQVVEWIVPVAPEPDAPRLVQAVAGSAPPGEAAVVQVAAGTNSLESLPAWPFESFVVRRLDWHSEQLARAELSRVAYPPLVETKIEDGSGGTRESPGPGAQSPATPSPPVSYRELLDRLLKESGAEKAERTS